MDRLKKDLILLNMLQDIGYIRLKALLDEFEVPEAIFNAPLHRLKQVRGIGSKRAESIRSARAEHDIDRELSLIEEHGVGILTVFDRGYPANLKQIYDPPPVLYVKGQIDQSDDLAIALVGSRRATLYGLRMAERMASGLGILGVTVVSGLARGIDTAAHKGALSIKTRTIAVLGNGLATVYPPENRKLAQQIVSNGALISEFPMQMPPHKANFPRRNRIISGLSKGVVVVEAAKRSGSLITADLALEENREVFAVPGGAGTVTSEGTNNLIKEGAHLVSDADDVIKILGISTGRLRENIKTPESMPEKDIYNLLSEDPCDVDRIIGRSTLGQKEAYSALLKLEMKGIIKQLPGKLYVRA